MSENKLIGINEGKLDSLVLEIYDSAERINNKFNLLEQLISDSQNYFDCKEGNEFRTKFNNTKSNFSIVNKNILNMASDLVKVKATMKKTNSEAIDLLSKSDKEFLSNSFNN